MEYPEYKCNAIRNLVCSGFHINADHSIEYLNGQTPPTEKEIDTEIARLKKEFSDNEYARNRASAYPSVGDQLDMIYKDNKNSTTTHADAVEAVKNKYPK